MNRLIPAIRRAGALDASLLANLGATTFFETFITSTTEADMAQYLAASFSPDLQRAELADKQNTGLIAEINNIAVGYAMLREGAPPDQNDAADSIELVRLYAKKEWHGHGVGATLMQACIDEARAQGFKELWLGVWEHNTRAQAFYHKWQFEKFGEHIFHLGGDPQNDFLMRRQL
jgi:ribosomal protein S18 acetylase RimI-like enzyme